MNSDAIAIAGKQHRLEAQASPGLRGVVEVPGDKSISHRALILGALAQGTTRIEGMLEGGDVLRTAKAVAAFGAKVERLAAGRWQVTGTRWRSPAEPVDCGNSGTAVRLLMGAAAGLPVEADFTGDRSLCSRPMGRVIGPLRTMGARIAAAEGGRLPVRLHGGGLNGLSFRNDIASAQVKSAILLAGLHARGQVEVLEPEPTRNHSETMLRAFGCEVETSDGPGGRLVKLGTRRALTGTTIEIPGDPSSAAFPLVATLIVPGSQVTVRSMMINALRIGLLATLAEMGADIQLGNRRRISGEEVADVTARAGPLRGVEVPASRAPSMIDEYPLLAVAAAFASGPTAMHGLSELRVKESDRLAATLHGLRLCGVEAREEGDALVVEGRGGPPAGGATVAAHDDHRIAMSFLVMGLASKSPVSVGSADMIATSFPGFVAVMTSLGARLA